MGSHEERVPLIDHSHTHMIASVKPKASSLRHARIHVDASVARSSLGDSAAAVCRDTGGFYLGSSALVITGDLYCNVGGDHMS